MAVSLLFVGGKNHLNFSKSGYIILYRKVNFYGYLKEGVDVYDKRFNRG